MINWLKDFFSDNNTSKFDLKTILKDSSLSKEENYSIQQAVMAKLKYYQRVMYPDDIKEVPREAVNDPTVKYDTIDKLVINHAEDPVTVDGIHEIKSITHQYGAVCGSSIDDIRKILKAFALIESSKSSIIRNLSACINELLHNSNLRVIVISNCEGFLDEVDCHTPAVTYYRDINKSIPELMFVAGSYSIEKLAFILVKQCFHLTDRKSLANMDHLSRNRAIQQDINNVENLLELEANKKSIEVGSCYIDSADAINNICFYDINDKLQHAISCMLAVEFCYPQKVLDAFPALCGIYSNNLSSQQKISSTADLFVVAPLFGNVRLEDTRDPPPASELLDVNDIRKMGFDGRPVSVPYVILKTGELIICKEQSALLLLTDEEIEKYSKIALNKEPVTIAGEARYYAHSPDTNDIIFFNKSNRKATHRQRFWIHPEISKFQPVIAAGEVYIINGKICSFHPSGLFGINNKTGHFLVRGRQLKPIVEAVFYNNGFSEAIGCYRDGVGLESAAIVPQRPLVVDEIIFNLPPVPRSSQITYQPKTNSNMGAEHATSRLLFKKFSDVAEHTPNHTTNWQAKNITGLRIGAENTDAQIVIDRAALRLSNNPSATFQSVLEIARKMSTQDLLKIYGADATSIGHDAAAATYFFPDGSRKVLLQTKDRIGLYREFAHELAHASLDLASPDAVNSSLYKEYERRIREAVCSDYWANKRMGPLVHIQKEVAGWIFCRPHSYPMVERLPERLAFTVQAIAESSKAVKSIAPRTYNVVCEYVAAEAVMKMGSNQLASSAHVPSTVKIWDVKHHALTVKQSYQPQVKNKPYLIKGEQAIHSFPIRDAIHYGRAPHWHQKINYAGLGRAVVGILAPPLMVWDISNRFQYEFMQYTGYSKGANVGAVATDFAIDYGIFGYVAGAVSSGVAIPLVGLVNIGCEIAHLISDIPAESVMNNRDFLMVCIDGYELSPTAAKILIDDFDNGGSKAREFMRNSATVTKGLAKPLEWLYDAKKSEVNVARDLFEFASLPQDCLLDACGHPLGSLTSITPAENVNLPDVSDKPIDDIQDIPSIISPTASNLRALRQANIPLTLPIKNETPINRLAEQVGITGFTFDPMGANGFKAGFQLANGGKVSFGFDGNAAAGSNLHSAGGFVLEVTASFGAGMINTLLSSALYAIPLAIPVLGLTYVISYISNLGSGKMKDDLKKTNNHLKLINDDIINKINSADSEFYSGKITIDEYRKILNDLCLELTVISGKQDHYIHSAERQRRRNFNTPSTRVNRNSAIDTFEAVRDYADDVGVAVGGAMDKAATYAANKETAKIKANHYLDKPLLEVINKLDELFNKKDITAVERVEYNELLAVIKKQLNNYNALEDLPNCMTIFLKPYLPELEFIQMPALKSIAERDKIDEDQFRKNKIVVKENEYKTKDKIKELAYLKYEDLVKAYDDYRRAILKNHNWAEVIKFKEAYFSKLNEFTDLAKQIKLRDKATFYDDENINANVLLMTKNIESSSKYFAGMNSASLLNASFAENVKRYKLIDIFNLNNNALLDPDLSMKCKSEAYKKRYDVSLEAKKEFNSIDGFDKKLAEAVAYAESIVQVQMVDLNASNELMRIGDNAKLVNKLVYLDKKQKKQLNEYDNNANLSPVDSNKKENLIKENKRTNDAIELLTVSLYISNADRVIYEFKLTGGEYSLYAKWQDLNLFIKEGNCVAIRDVATRLVENLSNLPPSLPILKDLEYYIGLKLVKSESEADEFKLLKQLGDSRVNHESLAVGDNINLLNKLQALEKDQRKLLGDYDAIKDPSEEQRCAQDKLKDENKETLEKIETLSDAVRADLVTVQSQPLLGMIRSLGALHLTADLMAMSGIDVLIFNAIKLHDPEMHATAINRNVGNLLNLLLYDYRTQLDNLQSALLENDDNYSNIDELSKQLDPLLLKGRLLLSATDYALRVAHSNSEENVSFDEWLRMQCFGLLQPLIQVFSTGLDFGSLAQSVIGCYSKIYAEKQDILDTTASLSRLLQAPFIPGLLTSSIQPGVICSVDPRMILFNRFMTRMNGNEGYRVNGSYISRFICHGQFSLRLAASLCTVAGNFVRANWILGNVAPALNALMLVNVAIQLGVTCMEDTSQEQLERKIHNCEVLFREMRVELSNNANNNELLPYLKLKAKNRFLDLKNRLFEYSISNPAQKSFYIQLLFYQHLYADEVSFESVARDGNGLFSAVSKYTIESADELREKAVNYMEEYYEHYQNFIDGSFSWYLKQMHKTGTLGDALVIHALSKVLNRPIIIFYADNNRGLDFKCQGLTQSEDFAGGDPIFVHFSQSKQLFNAVIIRGEINYEIMYEKKLILKDQSRPVISIEDKSKLEATRVDSVRKLAEAETKLFLKFDQIPPPATEVKEGSLVDNVTRLHDAQNRFMNRFFKNSSPAPTSPKKPSATF